MSAVTVGTISEIWRYPVKSMAGERLTTVEVQAGNMGLLGDRGWALRDDAAGEIRGAKNFPTLMLCSARYREPPRASLIPDVEITLPDGKSLASDDRQVHRSLSEFLEHPVSLMRLQPASDKAHYRRAQAGSSLIGKIARSRWRPWFEKLLPYTKLERDTRELLSREEGEPSLDYSTIPADLFEFTSPPGTYFDLWPLHLLTTASLAEMAKRNPKAAWDVRRFRPNFLISSLPELAGLIEAEWGARTIHVGEVACQMSVPTIRCGMTAHAQAELPKDPTVLRSIVREAKQNLGVYGSALHSGRVSEGDAVTLL
ncbi:MAG: MOSC N-terminal beta barrel domain-containing protein [Rhodocyclaceae bacterium]|nr:MOSC N-terminal beta barrel domain-containing protein [Rhodocyclaceae bacterium]